MADSDHQRCAIVVDRSRKFKGILGNGEPTTHGLRHRKWNNTFLVFPFLEKKKRKNLRIFLKVLD